MKKLLLGILLMLISVSVMAEISGTMLQDIDFEEVKKSGDWNTAIFKISAKGIHSANTMWWKATLIQNGEIISEEKGRNDIPWYSHGKYGTIWYNSFWVSLIEVNNDGITDICKNGPFTIIFETESLGKIMRWTFEVTGTKTAHKTFEEIPIEEEEEVLF